MSVNSLQFIAIQNSIQNGKVGNAIDWIEEEANKLVESGEHKDKSSAMEYLQGQYKNATGSVFVDEILANSDEDRSEFVDGFLEGIDIFDWFDTTSKQQALNDLADIEPSFGEEAGKVAGVTALGAAAGVAAGALIGGIVAGPAGALFGATVGPKVTKFLKKALFVGGAIGGAIGLNKIAKDKKELE